MGKITKRLVWQILSLVVLGVAVSLIAAWIQNDVLKNKFAPSWVAVIILITVTAIFLLTWKELRDEAAQSDDKRDLTREQRNRAAMLAKVKSIWVKGFLEQSLYGAALIELGKEYKPDAVHYPWSSVLQRPDQPDKSLPPETKTVEVFDAVGGELLILGKPGSGKTTMLLDLARDLIARAEKDDKLPIPVVFNLSSWAEKRTPLADWLAEELNFRYDVPKKIAAAWVKDDVVLPLLDGLDEVKLEHRSACVGAINQFRKEHGLLPTVVCSRLHDYEVLNAQLRLRGAIVLQPLTRSEIDLYLASVGDLLQTLRALLHHDQPLQELAESPLMLNIMVLAYRGLPIAELAVLDTLEKRRKHLFDTYVQRMFERRGSDKRYEPPQVIHWLSWLAQRLVQHDQTTFYLERMQPDWLQSQRRYYNMEMGLAIGLVFGVAIGLILGPIFGLVVGLACGLALVLGLGLEITTIETLQWSWSQAKLWDVSLVVGGLILGVIGGLVGGVVSGLVAGLVGGLVSGLIFGLRAGKEIETKTAPNQGMWRSAQNALLVGLVSILVIGPFARLVVGLFEGLGIMGIRLFGGFSFGLPSGLAFGLLGAWEFGGLACIQHAALRLALWRGGAMPLNYVRFLDYCAERIFLRKVGGGYIFVHRLLMEYFAGLGD